MESLGRGRLQAAPFLTGSALWRFRLWALIVLGVCLALALLAWSAGAGSASGGVEVVQTDPGLNQSLAAQPSLASVRGAAPGNEPVINVDDHVRYQRFAGAGAAMTDSSAWLISQLSASDQAALMQDLFGSDSAQIHLNFLRVPMGASDYVANPPDDPDPYTYDDDPPDESDPNLEYFSIDHDLPYVLPALQQARAVNGGLQIQANPWSPPAWMKTNGSLDNSDGGGTLLSSSFGPLAHYFVKFIQAYASNGVPIAAITPQNEPGVWTQYPGLSLSQVDEVDFISNYLAPALKAAGLTTKIYGSDLSWGQFSGYVSPLVSGSAAGDLAGVAWHCYFGSPTVMSQLQATQPRLDQIVNECSPEVTNFGVPEYLITSLRNWASVVSVWNVALDPEGGPKMEANGCPGCIGLVTIDDQGRSFSLGTDYYQMGQLSALVNPGAVRIASPNFVNYGLNDSGVLTVSAGLDDVAFLNPDGSKVLVAYNNSTNPISFAVQSGDSYFTYTIPAYAITTFTWA